MKYRAKLSGHSWSIGPQSYFDTIAEARRWAESYGNTADSCEITNKRGKTVASHRRSTENDGMSWFRASF